MLFDIIVVCLVVFVQIVSGIINVFSMSATDQNKLDLLEIGFSVAGGMMFLPLSLKVLKSKSNPQ